MAKVEVLNNPVVSLELTREEALGLRTLLGKGVTRKTCESLILNEVYAQLLLFMREEDSDTIPKFHSIAHVE